MISSIRIAFSCTAALLVSITTTAHAADSIVCVNTKKNTITNRVRCRSGETKLTPKQLVFSTTGLVAGEKGEKGDKGDTGPQGPAGPIGPAGLANIIESEGVSTEAIPAATIIPNPGFASTIIPGVKSVLANCPTGYITLGGACAGPASTFGSFASGATGTSGTCIWTNNSVIPAAGTFKTRMLCGPLP